MAGAVDFLKFPMQNGSVIVRLLPRRVMTLFVGHPFFTSTRYHRLGTGLVAKTMVCSKNLSLGKWVGVCPVCDYYAALYYQYNINNNKHVLDDARRIRAYERHYYNCLQLPDEVKVLSIGKELHDIIVASIIGDKLNKKKPLGNVADRRTGRNLHIVKEVTGTPAMFPTMKRSYFSDPSCATEDDDQWEKWLNKCHDLTALIRSHTVQELNTELIAHFGANYNSGYLTAWNSRAPTTDDELPAPKVSKYRSLDEQWQM